MTQSLDSFLNACEAVVGHPLVHTAAETLRGYATNVSGFERTIPAVLLPENTEQVQRIVHLANEHHVPLYSFSKGKNWGLGLRMPVRDGCVLMDLSRMNRIREVNTQYGYAVIEPGVTQKQLHDYLLENDLPFAFDVTGSAAEYHEGLRLLSESFQEKFGTYPRERPDPFFLAFDPVLRLVQ